MLSVAVIGAGRMGAIRARSIRDSGEGRVSVFCDIEPSRAEEAAREFSAAAVPDYRMAVSRAGVDAVVISTPTKFHEEIAVAALQAGKHVLCEKPLARTLEEARRTVQAAMRSGHALKTGFNYRHMAHVRKARQLLASGAIGPVYFLRCRFGHGGRPGYEKEWCTDAELSGGGVLQEQGIHVLDLARFFLDEPSRVWAQTRRYFWNFPQVEDNCFCVLESRSGQLAQLHASWTQWRNLLHLEIFGRDGCLQLEGRDGHYGPQRLLWSKRRPDHGKPAEQTFVFGASDDSWGREWHAFLELIDHAELRRAAAWEGLRTQQLVEAAYESARERRSVEIGDLALSEEGP
jgi:predicted dehydrogenase